MAQSQGDKNDDIAKAYVTPIYNSTGINFIRHKYGLCQ
ncbi:hypothetical protein AC520_4734 [Enterobacter sp. OLF]|nr:hypothetical protein AC520_4734 [Enterobacter sp. OLF]